MDWHKAIKEMTDLAEQTSKWKFGQENTIRWMSNRLKQQTGILIADEVGMGKTRIAMAAILAVMGAGGSVAVVVPPGLIYQWKKEWEEFLKSIGNKGTDTKSGNNKKNDPIMLRSYYSLFEDNSLEFPLRQNAGRWLLISHQFGPPLLRYDARPRRYMLPVLVKALIEDKNGKHKSNRYWQFVKKLYKGNEECIGGAYCPSKNKEGNAPDCLIKIKKDIDCNELPQINKAANYLKENAISLFDNDDLSFRSLESAQTKEYFKEEVPLWLKMINKLLGSIDLLIIDEAHKNRDVEDDPKRLGTILRDIIGLNDDAKRIALTATPMELNAGQWKEIFTRIGESNNYPEDFVDRFVNAHTEANRHPDNIAIIERLITASEDFVEKLKPYVTRRMRTKQKEMRELIGEDLCKEKAHPHREREPIWIDYREIEDEWKPSVFALEAIGKAAKGCLTDDKDLNKLLGRLKIADSRYAAGKISTSDADSTNKETDGNEKDESNDQQILDEAINKYCENNELKKIDDNNEYNRQSYIQGKLCRIQYWKHVLKSNNADPAGHPRIRKTADKIEEILWDDNGQLKQEKEQEKVLVFGTFLDPMKSLCDVLNRRTVLRLLDRKKSNDEPPIPGKDTCIDNLGGIWAEYPRMKSRLSRKYSSEDELKSAIEKGGKSYEDLRDKLTTHIDKKFVATLPGDAAIKKIENAEDDVVKLLRQRLVNDIICNDTEFKQDKKNDTKTKALYIWCEYLESYLDNENEPDHKRQPKLAWARPDYFTGDEEEIKKLIELDNLADTVSEEALNKLLKDELDHLSGRFGMFARMLYGGVKMETRRVLQSQFNDKNAFPKVLIAQSQVGREGLNLHKACRIVVQFHSEWNPGIIEQQIGRVDRIDSLWEEKAKEWNKDKQGDMPKITVIPVVFKGTYDSFQYGISKKRRENLNAHLFGELLNEEALEKLPKDVAIREKLEKAAPSFAPE